MDEARLTVLVPIKHYAQRLLEQSLRSITDQTCDAWRLIVIVEAQDREHFEAVLQWLLLDPRVHLRANQGRQLAGAINTGMRAAATEFVALLLADDLWALDAVGVLDRHIRQQPDVDFFHSSRRVVDADGNPISSVHQSRSSFALADFKHGSPVKHLLCWRRSTALAIGGLDETLNSVGPDDYDFPWTMAERGARFQAIPECLYYYRDHRDCYRLTTHLPMSVHVRECDRIMRKHGVAWWERKLRLFRIQRTFLRQCLYRNRLDQWFKERRGYDALRGWRETYD
jgi:glycosyltransferase involved in cell wall biosynthesis